MKAIETPEELRHCVEVMEQLDRRAERGETLTPEEIRESFPAADRVPTL
jgi:hypothetical protein